jgi:hypothetical protein
MSTAEVPSAAKAAQVRVDRVTPSRCRVVLDNPPVNLMGPEFVLQIREIVTALEHDDRVKVVVFESAVDGFFLNHSDFLARFEDLTSIPQGPTGCSATRWLGISASRWAGMTGDGKGPADGVGGAWWCPGCRGGGLVVVVSRWRG